MNEDRTTTVSTPTDREVISERIFAASPERVYAAVTDPELVRRWWGPREMETIVDEMDVRPGGHWRFVHRQPDGSETGFSGTYREIVPPERIVGTFEWEGMPGHVLVETTTLEDLGDERTKLITVSPLPHGRGTRRHARLRHEGRPRGVARAPQRAARGGLIGLRRLASARPTSIATAALRKPAGRLSASRFVPKPTCLTSRPLIAIVLSAITSSASTSPWSWRPSWPTCCAWRRSPSGSWPPSSPPPTASSARH